MTADRQEFGIEAPFPQPFPRMRIEHEIRHLRDLPSRPDQYICEEKLNGFGCLAYINKEKEGFALFAKSGKHFTTL